MFRKQFKTGDRVVYRKTKHNTRRPSAKAVVVRPQPRGEGYAYEVDKFWVVNDLREDGVLVLRSRRGKTHLVSPHDPNLRRATIWHMLVLGNRFPDSISKQATAELATSG